jgi:hypothetical protein
MKHITIYARAVKSLNHFSFNI